MKFTLLFLILIAPAPVLAQWYKFKKLPNPRPEAVESGAPAQAIPTPVLILPQRPCICQLVLRSSAYSLEAAERVAMKTAQHHMRYREYTDASYSFYDLAAAYALQNRFSEAKWYFLQSIFISRQQNNNRLTIADLVDLAAVKAALGDYWLARRDLTEALIIAVSCGWLPEVMALEKKLNEFQHKPFALLRTGNRYEDLSEMD